LAEQRCQTAEPFYQAVKPFYQAAGLLRHLAEPFSQTVKLFRQLAESFCQLAELLCQAKNPQKPLFFTVSRQRLGLRQPFAALDTTKSDRALSHSKTSRIDRL
jgi:hypothetical protein